MTKVFFMGRVTFLLFSFILFWAPGRLQADSSTVFESLRQRYFKLRNTDVQLGEPEKWRELVGDYAAFRKQYPKTKETPLALLHLSILYEELYDAQGRGEDLRKSTFHLEEIARDFPGHELADDALVRQGDIFSRKEGKKEAAKASYEEVIRAYPLADMYEVARARLQELGDEEGRSAAVADLLEEKPDFPSRSNLSLPVVLLDPGHGGEDRGAVGPGGLFEKDVVLAIALEVERLLRADGDVIVRLTRRGDRFIPLAERTAMANDYEASVFVSFHVNATEKGRVSGLETYYLDNTDDKASKRLAERENAYGNQGAGVTTDLSFMLSDLIQQAKQPDSVRLAHTLHREVFDYMKQRWTGVKDLGVKKAPFYVLVGAHMPCALLELFFISHDKDARNLANPDFRSDLAQGVYRGIQSFLKNSASR